jgi:hypothetical protein
MGSRADGKPITSWKGSWAEQMSKPQPQPYPRKERLVLSSDRFGYPSDEPCRVCGKHNNNQSEPRFGYTVCVEHQNVPPVKIPPAK